MIIKIWAIYIWCFLLPFPSNKIQKGCTIFGETAVIVQWSWFTSTKKKKKKKNWMFWIFSIFNLRGKEANFFKDKGDWIKRGRLFTNVVSLFSNNIWVLLLNWIYPKFDLRIKKIHHAILFWRINNTFCFKRIRWTHKQFKLFSMTKVHNFCEGTKWFHLDRVIDFIRLRLIFYLLNDCIKLGLWPLSKNKRKIPLYSSLY